MRFSVFTASTPDWTPQEAARNIAAQGWDGIEWRITDQEDATPPGFWAGNRSTWPLTGLEDSLPDIARITAESGLAMSGLGGYAQSSNAADVERMLRATAALGAGQVRVTMPSNDVADYRVVADRTRGELSDHTALAAELGVKVLIELHHRTITPSASAAMRIIDGFDPAHIGVIHDLGNLIIEGNELTRAALSILGDHLAHVHVKNAVWKPTGEVGPHGDVRWAPEWASLRGGQASVPDYFRALREFGYDGWVTVEDFTTQLPLEERLRDALALFHELRDAPVDAV
jgi:sugar phosphate isomerase/epimerase